MNIEKLMGEYYQWQKSQDRLSSDVIRELIEYKAKDKDNGVIKKLLKNLVINFAKAERELRELNELKNKFLGIAAHDLRSPLTSILGFSDILIDEEAGPLTENQKEFLEIINKTGKEMLTLINDLLDVSAIESGKLELSLKPASLKEILKDRIRIYRIVAESKEITLNESLSEIPEVLIDSNRIVQVIDNLISNAVKFSPSGSNIYITLGQKDNMIKVSVKDEGPGISEEDQTKLFGEFQKLSAQPTGGEKSTGLGLSIVKKIIQSHNGTIEVKSKVSQGTTFNFSKKNTKK